MEAEELADSIVLFILLFIGLVTLTTSISISVNHAETYGIVESMHFLGGGFFGYTIYRYTCILFTAFFISNALLKYKDMLKK